LEWFRRGFSRMYRGSIPRSPVFVRPRREGAKGVVNLPVPIGEVSLDSTYVPQFRLDSQQTIHIIGFGLVIRPEGGLSVLIINGLRKAPGYPASSLWRFPLKLKLRSSLTS